MKRMLILLAILVALILAFGAARPVAAQEMDFDQYHEAMLLFAPEVGDWIAGFEELAIAAMVKPEVRCGEELRILAEQGRRIVGDLQGTVRLAPRALMPDHDAITGGVAVMAQVVDDACTTKGSLLTETRAERKITARAMMHLRTVLEMRRPAPKRLPPQPGPAMEGLTGIGWTPR
jgi:hypothetical protein